MNTQIVSLGTMADSYYAARADRLAAQKVVDALKEKETVAEQILISTLKAQGLEGAKGHVANAAIMRSTKPNVTDRAAVEKLILDTGDLALLQFRVSITRLKELWDDGVVTPGVEPIEEESISLTKVKVK